MSTWFKEDRRTWPQKFFGKILKCGPLPKHVAIIMDGNRRYAKNHNLKKIEGHRSGFDKLVDALNWCFTMDVKEITVYAFSIENFKRSKEEVDGLFNLAREKFERLLNEREKIDELKVCIRMFGELSLLPFDLQQTIAKVMEISKHHTNLYMNVCLAYTSRDEMTMAVKEICNGVEEKKLKISDINESLIEKCLYTGNSYDVDLLVRTSGEVRLSDFLLWQSSYSVLSFVKKTWPEFSIWNFYMGILNYQINLDTINKLKKVNFDRQLYDLEKTFGIRLSEDLCVDKENGFENDDGENLYKNHIDRTEAFLNELHKNRSKQIEIIATTSTPTVS